MSAIAVQRMAPPQGSCWIRLDDILERIESGKSFKCLTRRANNGEWGIIKVSAMTWGSFDAGENKAVPPGKTVDPRHEIRPGDILLSRSNTVELVGASVLVPECRDRLLLSDKSLRLVVRKGIDRNWLQLMLSSPDARKQLSAGATGTSNSMRNVSQQKVRDVHLILAPLPEQRRIVAKIEELFSDLDAGIAALERAKANLKRYRAAVLKAAVEGKLTEQWRRENPDAEPASELLKRILVERRERWEAEQLAKYEARGKKPPKGWRDKYKEPADPHVDGLPELPEGWCWATVDQVGDVQLGRQRSPKHHHGPYMRPYLRVANVFEDRIDLADVMEMKFTPNEYVTYMLEYGDILLNEGQSIELVGRPAMYRDELPGSCFTNTLVRFRSVGELDPNYALRVFLAYLKNGRFQKIASITVNIAHLGAGRFAEIEFPLPPLNEQWRIVEEVDRHFSLIDAASRIIDESLARSSRLRQSILKRAFEGKLVPQDPNDEPATVLLERIKADRATATTDRQRTARTNPPATPQPVSNSTERRSTSDVLRAAIEYVEECGGLREARDALDKLRRLQEHLPSDPD